MQPSDKERGAPRERGSGTSHEVPTTCPGNDLARDSAGGHPGNAGIRCHLRSTIYREDLPGVRTLWGEQRGGDLLPRQDEAHPRILVALFLGRGCPPQKVSDWL